MEMHAHPRGFTLLELTIVLVIIAIIAGSALSVGTSRNEGAKLRETQAKLQRVEDAMIAFYILNGRLPCPAVASLAMDSPGFGQESREYGTCAEVFPSPGGTPMAPAAAAGLRVGTVPTHALNIPSEFAQDGWGRKFTYAVDVHFAANAPTFAATASGGITIQDNQYTPNVRSEEAIFVLISHGPNGNGGWLAGSGRDETPSHPGEFENAHDTANFDSINAIFTQAGRSATFDDIVIYRLKDQLVRSGGGIISTENCELAERTLRALTDIANDPLDGPVGCDENGDGIYNQDCVMRQTLFARAIHSACSAQESL